MYANWYDVRGCLPGGVGFRRVGSDWWVMGYAGRRVRAVRTGLTVRVCELVYAGPHRDSFLGEVYMYPISYLKVIGVKGGLVCLLDTYTPPLKKESQCGPAYTNSHTRTVKPVRTART